MGAWIETCIATERAQRTKVAPRVGAWIETYKWGMLLITLPSHPVWVRGLKQHAVTDNVETLFVAPRVGAWIETDYLINSAALPFVAPRVGAWIETPACRYPAQRYQSRTPCGCVD